MIAVALFVLVVVAILFVGSHWAWLLFDDLREERRWERRRRRRGGYLIPPYDEEWRP